MVCAPGRRLEEGGNAGGFYGSSAERREIRGVRHGGGTAKGRLGAGIVDGEGRCGGSGLIAFAGEIRRWWWR